VWLLARAHDASGDDVLGVYCDWTLGGVAQHGKDDASRTRGDLFRFRYAPDAQSQAATATHGALTSTLPVRAESGYVADTTYLGCSAAAGARSPSPWALLVGVALAVAARRARRRRAQQAAKSL
jgi:hypothetical protein